MIDRCVVVVTLIDSELEQMFRGRGDRRIGIADTALRFHRAPPSGNIIYDSFAERARMIPFKACHPDPATCSAAKSSQEGTLSSNWGGTSHKLVELQQGTLACRWKIWAGPSPV